MDVLPKGFCKDFPIGVTSKWVLEYKSLHNIFFYIQKNHHIGKNISCQLLTLFDAIF